MPTTLRFPILGTGCSTAGKSRTSTAALSRAHSTSQLLRVSVIRSITSQSPAFTPDPTGLWHTSKPNSSRFQELSYCSSLHTASGYADPLHIGSRGDTPPLPPQEQPPRPEHDSDDSEISDPEWEIRTGRAIDILQRTLPGFFETGLITSAHTEGNPGSRDTEQHGVGIYSPRIRLAYTPVETLPPPFPRTLHVEGLSLYLASALFLRHTLNALYTELYVELRHIRVQGPARAPDIDANPSVLPPAQSPRKVREKNLIVDLGVTGIARVSGARGGWDVRSTYAFSPLTGLIHQHTVDSIEPAPHQAVFDALRTALAKLGLSGGGDAGLGGPVARTGSEAAGPEDPEIEVLKGLLAGGGAKRS